MAFRCFLKCNPLKFQKRQNHPGGWILADVCLDYSVKPISFLRSPFTFHTARGDSKVHRISWKIKQIEAQREIIYSLKLEDIYRMFLSHICLVSEENIWKGVNWKQNLACFTAQPKQETVRLKVSSAVHFARQYLQRYSEHCIGVNILWNPQNWPFMNSLCQQFLGHNLKILDHLKLKFNPQRLHSLLFLLLKEKSDLRMFWGIRGCKSTSIVSFSTFLSIFGYFHFLASLTVVRIS